MLPIALRECDTNVNHCATLGCLNPLWQTNATVFIIHPCDSGANFRNSLFVFLWSYFWLSISDMREDFDNWVEFGVTFWFGFGWISTKLLVSFLIPTRSGVFDCVFTFTCMTFDKSKFLTFCNFFVSSAVKIWPWVNFFCSDFHSTNISPKSSQIFLPHKIVWSIKNPLLLTILNFCYFYFEGKLGTGAFRFLFV